MTAFYKFEAAGNDFILLDFIQTDIHGDLCSQNTALKTLQSQASALCDRHFGIGADGILIVSQSTEADFFMHIINADGSTAAMCGNGIRCAAHFYYKTYHPSRAEALHIETLGGLQQVKYVETQGTSWILDAKLAKAAIGQRCTIAAAGRNYAGIRVDTGNPHAVFESDDPQRDLALAGEALSHASVFPDRSNIEFIRPIGDAELEIAIYERGAGPTLACGTGCTAAACAYASSRDLSGQTIVLHAPGGTLKVKTPTNADGQPHLIGPDRLVFEGVLPHIE